MSESSVIARGAVAAAAGIAALGLLTPRAARAIEPALTFNDIPGTGDIKVLNYALALEDLEADLYAQAKLRLTTGGVNGRGTNIPGLNLPASDPLVQYTDKFGKVEAEHRDFLRGALGGAAISPFKYGFNLETATARQVADLLYTIELTGTQAYLGAIPFFATKTYLLVAGGIQATEARHTAVLAILVNQLGGNLNTAPLANDNNGIDRAVPPNTVLAAASPFIFTR